MGGCCSSAAPGLCMSVERFGCVFIFSHHFHRRFSIVCVFLLLLKGIFLCHIHSGSDILCFLLFKRSSRSCGRRHSITQSLWQAPSAKPAGSPTDSLRFAFAIQSTNPLFHSLQTCWVSDPIHQRVCGSDVWKKNAVTEVQLSFQQQRFWLQIVRGRHLMCVLKLHQMIWKSQRTLSRKRLEKHLVVVLKPRGILFRNCGRMQHHAATGRRCWISLVVKAATRWWWALRQLTQPSFWLHGAKGCRQGSDSCVVFEFWCTVVT